MSEATTPFFELDCNGPAAAGYYDYVVSVDEDHVSYAEELAQFCAPLVRGFGGFWTEERRTDEELCALAKEHGLATLAVFVRKYNELHLSIFYSTAADKRQSAFLIVSMNGHLRQSPEKYSDKALYHYGPHAYSSIFVSEKDRAHEYDVTPILLQRMYRAAETEVSLWHLDPLYTDEQKATHRYWENPDATPVMVTTVPDAIEIDEHDESALMIPHGSIKEEELLSIAIQGGVCAAIGIEDVPTALKALQAFGIAAQTSLSASDEMGPLWRSLVLQYAKVYIDLMTRDGCTIYYMPENEAHAKELAASFAAEPVPSPK